MKKTLVLALIISLIIQSIGGFTVLADVTLTGDGTAEKPYIIGTLDELIAFRSKVNSGATTACGRLAKDIDVSSESKWTPIGTNDYKYAGTFDGNGYKINGIKGNGSNEAAWGFFAYTNGGEIKNLTVSTGTDDVLNIAHQSALVVGIASNDTKITKCAGYGNVSGWGYIGGITYNGACTVTDCYYVGNISAAHNATAMGLSSAAKNCFAYGNITATTHAFRISNKSAINSYFLYSAGDAGTGGYGTQKNAEAFASGEVAYLLGDAFGQTLGTDEHPVFRTAENTVVKDGDSYINKTEEPEEDEPTVLAGDGSAENPYLIGTYDEIALFRDKVNKGETTACARLTNNIDISAESKWTSIGTNDYKYAGTFDGEGYEITGIKGSGSHSAAWGLFAYTDGGEIKNLTVSTGSYADTAIGHQAALVVGIASNDTKITRCAGYGNLSGWGYIGGITYNGACIVTDSYYVGNISAAHNTTAMGLGAAAKNCFAYGNITATTHAFKISAKSASNCYFLYAKGDGGTAGYGTQKRAGLFANGEVAYLLGEAFGQTIGTDEHPVFRTEDNEVIKNENGEYINEGGEPFVDILEISTYEELASFRDKVNSQDEDAMAANVKLMADIEIPSGTEWAPIGTWTSGANPFNTSKDMIFTGVFDGNGHKITNVVIEGSTSEWYSGFFRQTYGATIKNLTVEGNIGTFDGTNYSIGSYAGGLIGAANDTTIENCKFKGNVYANNMAGGFIARADTAIEDNSIKNCIFEGEVKSNTGWAAGFAQINTNIENSYFVGDVSGKTEVSAFGSYSGVKNSFVYGTVSATNGIVYPISNGKRSRVGEDDKTAVSNCYYENATGTKGVEGLGAKASQSEFKLGKVAYLLNQNAGEVIYGQTVNEDEYPIFYNNNMVYLTDGAYVNGNGAFAGVTAERASAIATEDTLVMVAQYAKYDEGLKLLSVTHTNVPANEFYTWEMKQVKGASVYKVFVVDSFNVMKPLANAVKDPIISKLDAYNLVTTFYDDEGTTRGFAWAADLEHEDMVIRYAKAEEAWDSGNAIEDAEYTKYEGRLYYKADIDNLVAGETYVYQIGDTEDNVWSEFYTFTTEPEDLTEFSFIGVTDPQSGVWKGGFEFYKKTLDEAFEDEPDAAFMVNLGDLVDVGYSQTEWDFYFDAVKGYAESIPHMAVVGNHETQGTAETAGLHFALQFNNPQNGAGALGNLKASDVATDWTKGVIKNFAGSAYSFEYGNAYFAVLNSGTNANEEDTVKIMTEQAKWLEQDLAKASDKKWKIVMVHQSMYPAKVERYDTRDELTAVVDKYGVDLVLGGHDHMVTRTYPMKNGQIVETSNHASVKKGTGVINAILGAAGPKRYAEVTDVPDYMALLKSTAGSQPTYSVFTVNDEKISVVTKQIDGTVVDSFEIVD